MFRRVHGLSVLTLPVLAVLAGSTVSWGAGATTADDVCAPGADPCSITDTVHVSPGATLDFGLRTLAISGRGCLDFGTGSATVLAGSVVAATTHDAIVAAGVSGGQTASGAVMIQARGACSAGSFPRPCLSREDCQLGACNTRRCSNGPQRACAADSDCAGTCQSGRCSNPGAVVRCTSDAECDFGNCGTQLTCSNRFGTPQACNATADCDLGSCSADTASIAIEGGIHGRSETPASIRLWAANSVSIRGDVDLSGTRAESGGGSLDIRAMAGDALVEGTVRARRGGGSVFLEAQRDAIMTGLANLTGGGGEFDLIAGRDARLDADVQLSARAQDFDGGALYLSADRDLWIGSGANPRRIVSNGCCGDGSGGEVVLSSGRDTHVAEGATICLRGSRGGYGGDLSLDAYRDFEFAGRYEASARGRGYDGNVAGFFSADIFGDFRLAPTAMVHMAGRYAGYIYVLSEYGNAVVDGSIRLGGDAGFEEGSFSVQACDVAFGGKIENSSTNGGYSRLWADRTLHLLPGSEMLTPKGENVLFYGNADLPPVVEGSVLPAPVSSQSPAYDDCPVCGDSEIEYPEDCEDGNVLDGDGCSSRCRTE